MKFEIKNRYTGEVKFTAEIDANEDTPIGIKIGLAVKWAVKTKEDLSESNLSGSDLSGSDLSGSNLSGSNLRGSDLSESNLSGVKNPPKSSADYFAKLTRDDLGFIVFRSQPGEKSKPEHWKWESGLFLTETPNPCRTTMCGSGVNFSTLEWAKQNYQGPYWKCRIRFEDMADVVVPFHTDGKARCARLELLEIVQ